MEGVIFNRMEGGVNYGGVIFYGRKALFKRKDRKGRYKVNHVKTRTEWEVSY